MVDAAGRGREGTEEARADGERRPLDRHERREQLADRRYIPGRPYSVRAAFTGAVGPTPIVRRTRRRLQSQSLREQSELLVLSFPRSVIREHSLSRHRGSRSD